MQHDIQVTSGDASQDRRFHKGGGGSFIGLGTFIQIKVHKKYNLNCTNEAPD